jgi:UDP-galactose transporter
LFAIPAFVYFVNNNLIFVILMYVSTTTYQVLSSMKTVFTGVLFRVVLKRILSEKHITAILVLACGAAVSQIPACVCGDSNIRDANLSALPTGDRDASTEYIGGLCTMLTCFLSAFAGVYSELLLKKDGRLHPIHLQNQLLYAWGILFNSLALFAHDREAIQRSGLFKGYTAGVWLLILNNALVGLVISAIFKFANNIVRVFAHTGAMVITMVLETLVDTMPFSAKLVVSVTIVGAATFLYNSEPPPTVKDALAREALTETASFDKEEVAQARARTVKIEMNGNIGSDYVFTTRG